MCDFTRIPGKGPFHFVCVPGLVPDGPETFLRQLPLLRRHGSLSIITYPYESFSLDRVIAALRAHIAELQSQLKQVILVGVSVGGGICLELLKRSQQMNDEIDLAGLILMSPCSHVDDLAPLLSRLMTGIKDECDRAELGEPVQALERGRAFFRSLASRSAGPKTIRSGRWWSLLSLLTPQGLADLSEARIRARIERTLAAIPPQGGIQRVLALQEFQGIGSISRGNRALTQAPTLILWGSKERHTLNMNGPGTHVLSTPDLAVHLFPRVTVQWVYTARGEEVPHASLLKHSHAFNHHLRQYLGRRAAEGRRGTPILFLNRMFALISLLMMMRHS